MYVTVVIERMVLQPIWLHFWFVFVICCSFAPDTKKLLDEKRVRREECEHPAITPTGGWVSKEKIWED